MKNLKYVITLLLLAFVVYAGPGVSWIQYGCHVCEARMDQKEVDASSCCCAEKKDTSCCSGQTETNDRKGHDCCQLKRIGFDWESSSHPVYAFDFIGITAQMAFVHTDILLPVLRKETLYSNNEGPPHCAPRTYLSLIRVLII